MSAQLQAQTGALAESVSLLDDIVAKSKVAKTDTEHARAKDIIGELVKEVLDGTVVVSDNLSANIDARIAEIDQLISDQLSEVMHGAEFQKLESSWTGLQYLCKQTSTGEQMKIKVLNTTKKELVK
ncbi:MAG: type VI secretion system contractile sheath large subunit, partial [Aquabacterium sp.]|uniref:type VI secretion system contractile sheath domain-containing protein n=1 Tax=Aquabacterium sp. TaxID=1872578 RepID=UPI0012128D74